jgi:hypothetical protein
LKPHCDPPPAKETINRTCPRFGLTYASLNTRTCLKKSRGVWGPAPKENNAQLLPKNEIKNDFESAIDKN